MLFVEKKQYFYRCDMSERRPLTPEELADAGRLELAYKNWKAERRAAGERVNQEMVAARLGISQSAFSQYCRGAIPINVELLTALHAELSIDPHTISPRLAKEMAEISDAAGTPFDRDHYRVRLIDAALSAGAGKVAFSRDVRKHLAFRKDFLLKQTQHLDELGVFPVAGDSMDKMHIVDGAVVLLNMSEVAKEPIKGKLYGVWVGDEIFIKELVKEGRQWFARSHSSCGSYPDIHIDTNAGIVGRAFWVGFAL
ncbi:MULTISPECIES: XRE family transcriptional regulator [Achromobacter]|jgi:phage repressor protein C with HTH and peptisase S24 domain|uniref:XRE family transcriptional regulator n=1 Tax=Achromobacter TaxID=222 RepID=UPI0006C47AD2|nr:MULTISPECIES: S24 family peptidase [Achromobacter]MDF3939609.1 S24 family peptidase [Achromobacter denitrificans]QQE57442.1 hypothetical protein I6H41_32010 [Achromobacter xylosoxidans]QQV17081.1 hypothetical protein I6I48_14950 [Achromobacter xylosoxidans]CUI48480.1 Uncharacterised protein [Achromobacter xylosoxidans]